VAMESFRFEHPNRARKDNQQEHAVS